MRNYYEGYSETDILMRLIDNLRDDVISVKRDQDGMNGMIDRMITFVKRIELHTV